MRRTQSERGRCKRGMRSYTEYDCDTSALLSVESFSSTANVFSTASREYLKTVPRSKFISKTSDSQSSASFTEISSLLEVTADTNSVKSVKHSPLLGSLSSLKSESNVAFEPQSQIEKHVKRLPKRCNTSEMGDISTPSTRAACITKESSNAQIPPILPALSNSKTNSFSVKRANMKVKNEQLKPIMPKIKSHLVVESKPTSQEANAIKREQQKKIIVEGMAKRSLKKKISQSDSDSLSSFTCVSSLQGSIIHSEREATNSPSLDLTPASKPEPIVGELSARKISSKRVSSISKENKIKANSNSTKLVSPSTTALALSHNQNSIETSKSTTASDSRTPLKPFSNAGSIQKSQSHNSKLLDKSSCSSRRMSLLDSVPSKSLQQPTKRAVIIANSTPKRENIKTGRTTVPIKRTVNSQLHQPSPSQNLNAKNKAKSPVPTQVSPLHKSTTESKSVRKNPARSNKIQQNSVILVSKTAEVLETKINSQSKGRKDDNSRSSQSISQNQNFLLCDSKAIIKMPSQLKDKATESEVHSNRSSSESNSKQCPSNRIVSTVRNKYGKQAEEKSTKNPNKTPIPKESASLTSTAVSFMGDNEPSVNGLSRGRSASTCYSVSKSSFDPFGKRPTSESNCDKGNPEPNLEYECNSELDTWRLMSLDSFTLSSGDQVKKEKKAARTKSKFNNSKNFQVTPVGNEILAFASVTTSQLSSEQELTIQTKLDATKAEQLRSPKTKILTTDPLPALFEREPNIQSSISITSFDSNMRPLQPAKTTERETDSKSRIPQTCVVVDKRKRTMESQSKKEAAHIKNKPPVMKNYAPLKNTEENHAHKSSSPIPVVRFSLQSTEGRKINKDQENTLKPDQIEKVSKECVTTPTAYTNPELELRAPPFKSSQVAAKSMNASVPDSVEYVTSPISFAEYTSFSAYPPCSTAGLNKTKINAAQNRILESPESQSPKKQQTQDKYIDSLSPVSFSDYESFCNYNPTSNGLSEANINELGFNKNRPSPPDTLSPVSATSSSPYKVAYVEDSGISNVNSLSPQTFSEYESFSSPFMFDEAMNETSQQVPGNQQDVDVHHCTLEELGPVKASKKKLGFKHIFKHRHRSRPSLKKNPSQLLGKFKEIPLVQGQGETSQL